MSFPKLRNWMIPNGIGLSTWSKFNMIQESETHSHIKWKCVRLNGKYLQDAQMHSYF